jgi:hypothetical protein
MSPAGWPGRPAQAATAADRNGPAGCEETADRNGTEPLRENDAADQAMGSPAA